MSPTIRHKYKYFHSTVQRAKDRQQNFISDEDEDEEEEEEEEEKEEEDDDDDDDVDVDDDDDNDDDDDDDQGSCLTGTQQPRVPKKVLWAPKFFVTAPKTLPVGLLPSRLLPFWAP